MKRLLKKSLVIVTLFVMLVSTVTAFAATPRWSHLAAIQGTIEVSNGVARITVFCDASTANVTKVKAKCELQKYDDSWKTIKTWTETQSGTFASYEKTYAVAKGYDYRLRVTGYAYNGSTLLEEATEYFD